MRDQAFLFDLDGTLVDSVYQHVLASQEALDHAGIAVSVWRIHRRIATSGYQETAGPVLARLEVPAEAPVVTRNAVEHAKPDPDLFLAAAARLGVDIAQAMVIGDSVWDMLAARRARALGVGLLSGRYGQEELERAGAYRVYEDPADLLRHLDEVGIRVPNR